MNNYRLKIDSKNHGTYTYRIEKLQDYEFGDDWIQFAMFISGSTDKEELIENAKNVVKEFNSIIGEFKL